MEGCSTWNIEDDRVQAVAESRTEPVNRAQTQSPPGTPWSLKPDLAWAWRRATSLRVLTLLVGVGYLGSLQNPLLPSEALQSSTPNARWWLDLLPVGPVVGAWFAARALRWDQRLWSLRTERHVRAGAIFQLSLGAFLGSSAVALGAILAGTGVLTTSHLSQTLPTLGWTAIRTGLLGAFLVQLIRRPIVFPILLWWAPFLLSSVIAWVDDLSGLKILSAWVEWPSGPLPLDSILGSGIGFLALAGWWVFRPSKSATEAKAR